ncbi:hypothetical protein SE17_28660 [Kouleothrix aurantiaca]|uniref:N-acetyltransferase domain-containing protein n=1 Tax=Kouleothrix aurantiaca TaxID=186479 RepID=A0A0P9FC37_9CHLR|nr:hypothetical protein SE17_28660 [Kouleothrix aurantiaca]
MALRVAEHQVNLVASTLKSLAEAYVDPTLTPLAVYDASKLGLAAPSEPMIGFTMYERKAGVGFIQRLLIDHAFQGRGYGSATMREVIRRLRLYPDVQRIATSYRVENRAAAQLYARLGFQPWSVPWNDADPDEVYVFLPS